MNEPNWSQIDRDRIAELEAENKRLREALEAIVEWAFVEPIGGQDTTDYKERAREALKGKGG